MKILLIMTIGIAVGWYVFPDKWQSKNEKIQLISILVLIFCMGVSLGNNPHFMSDLMQLGIKSLVFSILPIIGSIGFVYVLSEKYLQERKDD